MGVMPKVGGDEPYRWAENEAKVNNALYSMFYDQQLKRAAQEERDTRQHEFQLGRDAQQQEYQLGRDAANNQFRGELTREGWDRMAAEAFPPRGGRAGASPNAEATKTANRLIKDLMKDGLSREHAAGLVAEAMAESGDFTQLQEKAPLVPGSRGGGGYLQWTGPRRQAFEAYAQRGGYDPASYEANSGYLREELKGPEGTKLKQALAGAKDAWEAAQIVRRVFLRPQSTQEGWQDVGRDRRVRARLNLPDTDTEPPVAVAGAGTSQGGVTAPPITDQRQPAASTTPPAASAAPPAGARRIERMIDPKTGKMVFREVS